MEWLSGLVVRGLTVCCVVLVWFGGCCVREGVWFVGFGGREAVVGHYCVGGGGFWCGVLGDRG